MPLHSSFCPLAPGCRAGSISVEERLFEPLEPSASLARGSMFAGAAFAALVTLSRASIRRINLLLKVGTVTRRPQGDGRLLPRTRSGFPDQFDS